MNFKSEDFSALVSPTRRMVYGAFASFFGAVMIPCLRRFMSLGNTVRTNMSMVLLNLLGSPAVMGVRSGVTWVSRIVDRVVRKVIATGRNATESVIIHGSEFCGKTRGFGSTSTMVDIALEML